MKLTLYSKGNKRVSVCDRYARLLSPALLAALGLFTAGHAVAQELEVITVTAQKRVESLQETPVAITAFSQEQMERLQVRDLRDLDGFVPNVTITAYHIIPYAASINIRGVGVLEPDGFFDPSVGVVVDGVYQARSSTALLDLFDIERVEVLRGPQGTLFGANTIGGVVNVITRQPTGEFGVRGKVSLGNYGRTDAMVAVDFPIIEDVLAGKISALSKNSSGFYHDLTSDSRGPKEDIFALRGYLKFEPNENFDATLIGEFNNTRNGSPANLNLADPGDVIYQPPFYSREDFEYITHLHPRNRADITIRGATLTMNQAVGEGSLVSISSYRHVKENIWNNHSGSILPEFEFDTHRPQKAWQATQELRLTVMPTDTTELLIGAYYFRQHYELDQTNFLGAFTPGFRANVTNDQDDEAWSAFTQGYWNATDALTLQAGIRFTTQKKDMFITSNNFLDGAAFGYYEAAADERWNDLGWKLGADYQINPDMMAYGYYARGFKSGGFNGRITSPAEIGPYSPEELDTFEIGLKSDLLNRRLRINIAGFYNIYRDMQVQQSGSRAGTVFTEIDNAAKAEMKGIEIEVAALPVAGLQITGSLGYLDAKYKRFLVDLDNIPVTQEDGTHLRLRSAPEWRIGAGAQYSFDLFDGSAAISADYTYTSSQETIVTNHPVGHVDSYHQLHATARWSPASEAWEIAIWGRNLTDERFIFGAHEVQGINNIGGAYSPRTYGVDLSFQF